MRIRPVEPADAALISGIAAHREMKKSMLISNIDFTGADKIIAGLTELDHMFVLESETPPTEICAVLLLRVDPQIYLRRLARVEIMVAAKWQGQGLGQALLQSALELADKELMTERLEAEILTDNMSALKLFKSCGFKVEGTARDWASDENGTYVDACLLARCRP